MIWGSTFLVIRVGNDALPALWACSLRLALAAVLLSLILAVTRQKWPKGAALKAAAIYGFWEFGISLPLLYWGERVVPSGLAAVLYAICPVAAMFEARMLGMERLDLRRLGAAALAFAGVVVIFWGELAQGGSPAGLIAIFVAAVAAPMAGLMLQRGPDQGAIGTNAVGALAGLPLCLLASLLLGEKHPVPATAREAFPVAYLAIAGSVGAFVLFAWLLRHWKATSAAFLGVIVPVIAVVLGAIVRHEPFTLGSLAGGVVVLVGVVIALRAEGSKVAV